MKKQNITQNFKRNMNPKLKRLSWKFLSKEEEITT